MSDCIFLIGSATHAMEAKQILANYSISVFTEKVSTPNRGCIHGIKFNCRYRTNIENILEKNKIRFEDFRM